MLNLRRTAATIGAAALLATPLAMLGASPASADADREFRYAGAEHEFDVEKDNGRFKVEFDIDDAKRGSKWRVVIRHDGKVIHKRVHRADSDGDVEINKNRPDTKGKDVFKVKVKKVGAKKAATRTIVRR
ncbi:hypothetical protein ASG90_04440 [Nocardioides sp. Soil797]|nr:hypothetical protein ASG90_04440 [Nocardioides sp. Soil797]